MPVSREPPAQKHGMLHTVPRRGWRQCEGCARNGVLEGSVVMGSQGFGGSPVHPTALAPAQNV